MLTPCFDQLRTTTETSTKLTIRIMINECFSDSRFGCSDGPFLSMNFLIFQRITRYQQERRSLCTVVFDGQILGSVFLEEKCLMTTDGLTTTLHFVLGWTMLVFWAMVTTKYHNRAAVSCFVLLPEKSH